MKKIRWATHKSLFGQIATSSCLLAVSAGVIFGVSAGTFKIEYLNLNSAEARLKAVLSHDYFNQSIVSQWNMFQQGKPGEVGYVKPVQAPSSNVVEQAWWDKVHPGTVMLNKKNNDIDPALMELDIKSGTAISATATKERTKYSALVIDGATHTALDRSFNQGLYNGLANFNTNIPHDVVDNSEGQVFKPSQDSTQEFINIYRAVAAKSRVLALAGFNHVTPLNALGVRNDQGIFEFADKNIANAGMMLMDGDIANNQNVASVLFRSDQPAFLTALATGMYFYNNLDKYHDHYQDISVATYGGTAIPTVIIYMGGFQRGIEFFNRIVLRKQMLLKDGKKYIIGESTNEDAKIQSDYFEKKLLPASKHKAEVEELKAVPEQQKTTPEFKIKLNELLDKLYDEYSIKMIKLGDFATHFSGSFSPGDAIGISKQYLNRGASAILAVAGPQSLDTAQEIMNQNSKCIIIGVDSAMERSDYQKPFKSSAYTDNTVAADGTHSAQVSNIIKFSAVKDMTNVSNKILRLAATGKHWDVNNTKPWLSASEIPGWTAAEEVPFDEAHFNIEIQGEDYFDVIGFNNKNSPAQEIHVINIPTIYKKDGKEYKLRNIYGFSISDPLQKNWLSQIDTLKITNSDKTKDYEIKFGQWSVTEPINAFDYSGWTTSDEKPGIKYIDLSGINCKCISTMGSPFNQMCEKESATSTKADHNGIIKLHQLNNDKVKEDLYSALFTGVSTSPGDPWAIVEPDPYESICSFGFKTCGNIENGLISISWDGWPYLIDALRHCTVVRDSAETPFMANFSKVADAYIQAHESEISEDFKNLVHKTGYDWKGYSTFDTNSPLNKEYAHLMSILGTTLKESNISFPADMTILLDEDGKPYLPKDDTPMSILDWLRVNMYFTL